MPTYEYECKSCGRVFEAVQKITEEPLAQCVSCEGPVKRLISQCSFQLKGSGWYVTDYKRGGATSSGNGGNGNGAKEEKTETKTESATSETPKAETPKAEAPGGTT
jgi:putative FmdB family regulatory protein